MASPHCARGWRQRRCRTCRALPGEPCRTPSGRDASRIHSARLTPERGGLASRLAVWEELERRGVRLAAIPFSGRAGAGGRAEAVQLHDAAADRPVDDSALAYALQAPVWGRYGGFAGQPHIRAELVWKVEARLLLIAGLRGGERFEEVVP